MIEKQYPYRNMPTELNQMWQEIFGHTFQQCFDLAKLNSEVGTLHKGHIKYILRRSIEEKPPVTQGEDG